ncbi:MAG: hypothetical protein U5L00_06755 [Desulfovermiculus sp.]|nr:hypothetical protein [Desulfovermiculus sp.]
MSYLERLKNRESEDKTSESNHGHLQNLLRQVGAKIETGPRLVFNPLLDGPRVNPERWEKAVELEGMFWEAYEEGRI